MKPKTPHVDLQAQIAATLAEARAVMAEADCLHDAAAVKAAYDRLGHEITARYADLNPLILTVMNGGLLPTAEIVSRLPFAFEQDYLHATRWSSTTFSTRAIRWWRFARPCWNSSPRALPSR